MDKFTLLKKEIEKTMLEYKNNSTPAEEKAFNAGYIAGLKRTLEIIEKNFQQAIK